MRQHGAQRHGSQHGGSGGPKLPPAPGKLLHGVADHRGLLARQRRTGGKLLIARMSVGRLVVVLRLVAELLVRSLVVAWLVVTVLVVT
jgi:hypothetical protein